MSTQELFDQYKKNLHAIQLIIYDLKSVQPDNDLDISELRSNDVNRVLELYDQLDFLNAQIEYIKFKEYNGHTREMQYEFANLKERYCDLKIEFRKAQLKSKEIEYTSIKEDDVESDEDNEASGDREAKGGTGFNDRSIKKISMQEKLLGRNSQVTNKLQNINSLMQSTILANDVNIQDLTDSTKGLSDLSEKYNFFGDVLVKTNKLVKTINASSNSEKKRIYRALYFFGFVCLWILYRRILRKPLALAFWILFKFISVFLWMFKAGGKDYDEFEDDLIIRTMARKSISSITTSATTSFATSVPTPLKTIVTTIVEEISGKMVTSLITAPQFTDPIEALSYKIAEEVAALASSSSSLNEQLAHMRDEL